MKDPSDTMLMALADNELPADEAALLRERIAADPVLAARFAVFVETRAALHATFAADGPVPDRLIHVIEAAPASPSRPTTEVLALRRRMPNLVPPMAVAASLLLAFGLGAFFAGPTLPPNVVTQDPAGLAAISLAAALTGEEVQLSQGRTARVLGSYQTDYGLCRTIELDLPADGTERAVVCRAETGQWSVVAAVAAGTEESYVTASDTTALLIDQVLDNLGAGPALDQETEMAALAP